MATPTIKQTFDEANKVLQQYGMTPVESTPTDTITSDDFQPSNPLTPISPQYPPTPTIDSLNSEIENTNQLTAPETDAQNLYDRIISEINPELAKEREFRAQERERSGILGFETTQRDLSSQLRRLQGEAKAIPTQIQQGAEGRGITAGGAAPLERGRLRDNAVKALFISGMLDATNQEIASAKSKIEEAVELKFGALRAEKESIIENLNLIINSPEYTIADKKRAQKQLALQEQKEKLLKEQENNQKEIWGIATDAAKNGADALTIRKIQEATTKEEALKIASESGAAVKTDTQVVSAGGRELLIDSKTGKTIKDLGASKVTGGGGGGISGLTQAIIDNPSLYDDLTPTERGNVLTELQAQGYETSNLGTKGLSDTAIGKVADTQKAISDLTELRTIIENNQNLIGPIRGLRALNPFDPARKIQADVNRVKQTVGKALEGGVLRKEDEEKYKKILATLTDTPSTALYKVDALLSSIQRDIENYKLLQGASGRSLDVRTPLGKAGATTTDQLRKKYNY